MQEANLERVRRQVRMTDKAIVEEEFDGDIRQILEKEKQVGYSSTRFRQMLDQHGSLEASHRLLEPDRQFPKGTFVGCGDTIPIFQKEPTGAGEPLSGLLVR